MKKRPLSLLELIIGLSLTAILLSSLFASFRQISMSNASVQRAHGVVHERAFLQLRLEQMFRGLSKDTCLKKTEHGLTFTYKNFCDLEPDYCGSLQGKLLVQEGRLILFSTPPNKDPRAQILFENVSDISWEFFDLKNKKWLLAPDKKQFPLQVKLTPTQKNDQTHIFIFQLPQGGLK